MARGAGGDSRHGRVRRAVTDRGRWVRGASGSPASVVNARRLREVGRRGLSRRAVLRGAGALLALPVLEATRLGTALAAPERGRPLRCAFLFVPNGKEMAWWRPATQGADAPLPTRLPRTLAALERHRERLLVLSGLAQDEAHAKGDGPGDHARSSAVFLTGVHPVKTSGRDIRVGVSVDQVMARHVGRATWLPSLELGTQAGARAGNCDSGYSCAYSSNISWRAPSTPQGKEVDPRVVFERLFGSRRLGESPQAAEERRRRRRSVLDAVGDDARRLKQRLGRQDRDKLDEYLAAVRALEQRVERAEGEPADPESGIHERAEAPSGVPRSHAEHIRLMMDLLVKAFETDRTRVASFMLANAGSNRHHRWLDVPEGHHGLSHHRKDKAKQAKIQRINAFHVEQLAYLLDQLAAVRVEDRRLLDDVAIVYGSGISDGNRHNHDDLPILLAGGGAGSLRGGRHLVFRRMTPLNNLFWSLLERMGVAEGRIGDATGPLAGLA